jgi:hypothetical protein
MKTRLRIFFKDCWLLLVIVAAKFILQYTLVNPYYELHRDEFLHLDQAHHLALGYISVPPLTSVFSGLIFLLGGDIFWVRFFPALFGALTIVFAWLIVESLDGGIIAKILVSLALLFSVLIRLNILFQPNSFDILIWTVIFFCFVKFIKSGNNRWLWFLAVSIALAFYNKYTVAFPILGLFSGFLFTSQRKILTQPVIWKTVMLTLILILPNIVWQVVHDFPVIDHMRKLKEYQLDNNSSTDFLKSQLLIFAGSLPLTISGLIAFILYKPFKPYRFAGITFVVTMFLFTLFKAKDYYAIGLFPVLFAFAAVYLEKILTGSWRIIILPFVIAFNLFVFLQLAKFVFPVLNPEEIISNKKSFEKIGLLRWEDGKNHALPQDFADMTGWKEMSDIALEAYRMIPENEIENTLVFCDNYGQTGALNYYNRGKMKEAYSFNTDYIYWLPRMERILNVILVGEMPDDRVIKLFDNFKFIGSVENEFAREKGTGIYILTGASLPFTEIFYNLADERKRNLDIF